MINIKQLKERLKRRIDRLSEDKLQNVSEFLESLDKDANQSKILSYAGSWNNMDDNTFNEFTQDLTKRRKNNRTRFFE